MSEKHFLRDTFGCPIHSLGHTDGACTCKKYWAEESECSDRMWADNHDPIECGACGGACGTKTNRATVKPEIPDCVVRTDALMAIVDNTVKVGINDLWYSAYYHIARFALPLVKRLRESKGGVNGIFFDEDDPLDYNVEASAKAKAKQNEVYDKIIFALEMIVSDNGEGDDAEIQEGLDLFGKYFRSLWD